MSKTQKKKLLKRMAETERKERKHAEKLWKASERDRAKAKEQEREQFLAALAEAQAERDFLTVLN